MFLSIYCLYALSEKVEYDKEAIMLFLANNSMVTKGLSVLFAILGFWILSFVVGTTNGIISGAVLWSLLASLILLFAPFKNINLLHVGLVIGLIVGVEFIFLT
ncbi:MAG: hypothetical protein AAGC85_06070 [Bacteroidota bacterium]